MPEAIDVEHKVTGSKTVGENTWLELSVDRKNEQPHAMSEEQKIFLQRSALRGQVQEQANITASMGASRGSLVGSLFGPMLGF